MAQRQYPIYPVRALVRHPFDTFKRAPLVTEPVLQLHSHSDEVVPYERGAALAERWPADKATFLEVDGISHNRPMLRHHTDARVAYTGFLESIAQR